MPTTRKRVAIPDGGKLLFRPELGQEPISLPEAYTISADVRGDNILHTSTMVTKHHCQVNGNTVTLILGLREPRNAPGTLYLGQASAIMHNGGVVQGYLKLGTRAIGLPGMLGTNYYGNHRLCHFFRALRGSPEMTEEEWVLLRVLAGLWNHAGYLGIKPEVPVAARIWERYSRFDLHGGFEDFVERSMMRPLEPYDKHKVNVRLRTKSDYGLGKAFRRYCFAQVGIDDCDIDLSSVFDTDSLGEILDELQDSIPDDSGQSARVKALLGTLFRIGLEADADVGKVLATTFQPEPGIYRLQKVEFCIAWKGGTNRLWSLLTQRAFATGSRIQLLDLPWGENLTVEIELYELNTTLAFRQRALYYVEDYGPWAVGSWKELSPG